MPLEISQFEYVQYTQYIDDIINLEKCYSKPNQYKVYFNNNRFSKIQKDKDEILISDPLDGQLTKTAWDELSKRITFITDIHQKISGDLKDKSFTDNTPLVANYYNTHLKTICAWNKIFKSDDKLHISTPNNDENLLQPVILEKAGNVLSSEKMISDYFNILARYPKLKREGGLNNHKLGTYEIVYDKNEIFRIQKKRYEQLYQNAIKQNKSDNEAIKIATEGSKAGLVFENQFWIILSDVVKFPNGFEGIYSRHIQKTDLEGIGGVAVLPITKTGDGKKIDLILTFRHATQDWEFELPRGGTKKGESPTDAARREMQEEAKSEVKNLIHLGDMPPDSGLTASIIPIYSGEVVKEVKSSKDDKEAIKGKYSFTINEVKDGLKRGYLEIELNGKMSKIPFRDPFLTYALFLAECNELLSLNSLNSLLEDKFPDKNYEKIGKKGFQWRKEYLAWNEKTNSFYFQKLNFLQVIFRNLFGWWSNTHLSVVLKQIDNEKKEKLPPGFLLRMNSIWKAKYPNKARKTSIELI